MARSRPLRSSAAARREARELAEAGWAASSIVNYLSGNYRGRPASEYAALASEVIAEVGGARILQRSNRGAYGNPARLLGCTDPDAEVRVSVVIRGTDANTGRAKRWYEDAIHLGRTGRLGEIIDDMLTEILARAREQGYELDPGGSGQLYKRISYAFGSAECV